jgi:very-short-patch-repair endonuclease
MAQPVKKEIKKVHKIKKVKKIVSQGKKKHKEYGTSKLEEKFAKEFLEKLGVNYVYQYKAESIGRCFDFYIPSANLIIEIDGDYWHSYNVEYENMTPTQKRNKRVDEAKDKWAVFHGIPVLRIWEHDINKNPTKVMQILKEKLSVCSDKVKLEEEKKKRH